jgi:hypothetical protein
MEDKSISAAKSVTPNVNTLKEPKLDSETRTNFRNTATADGQVDRDFLQKMLDIQRQEYA